MHRSVGKSVTMAAFAEPRKSSRMLYEPRAIPPEPRVSFHPSRFQLNKWSSSSLDSSSLGQGESSSNVSSGSKEEKVEELTRFNVSEVLYEDVDEVKELMNDKVLEVFNVKDPFLVIHNCYISYKLTNHEKKIVGIICMDEYPNVPALPSVGWSQWADKLYNIKDLSSYNSLWVHLAAFDERYKDRFLYPMLNNLFHELMTKLFVLFVIPKGCHNMVDYLDGCSSVVLPQDFTDSMKVQTIRLCVRQDFITQYKIRRAVEEDNDDLVPLIHQFSPRFVELYGEYYVAEIISRHPEAGRKIIVAEHEGEAVSVLCLNPTVNYEQLNDCFDLHVFTGLYKAETAKQMPKKPAPKSPVVVEPVPEITVNLSERHGSSPRQKIRSTLKEEDLVMTWLSFYDQPDPRMSSDKSLTFSIFDDFDDNSAGHSSTSIMLSLNRSHTSEAIVSEETSTEPTTSVPSQLPFSGTENAFAIEILAAHSKHQPSLPLLILSGFECFPTRDYCLLMIPHDADYTAILNYFVWVPPKPNSQHPHELYVCHRGQLSPIRIHTAGPQDAEKVRDLTNLIAPPNTPGDIVSNFEKGLSGEAAYTTLLALSGKHHRYPVGIAQVAKVTDLSAIKLKYAINRRSDIRRDSDGSFGYLLCFVMAPQFKGHLKYFLREIHRKTDFKTLFYALNHHDGMDYRIRPLSFALKDMWLVQPRKIRVSMKKAVSDHPEEPYALFMSTSRLMSKPVVQINYRIVVVGASNTALSFLEKLLTNEVTQCLVLFNNVLLVSTDGLIRNEKFNHVKNMLVATRVLRDANYLEKIGIRSKLSVLKGTLTGIDRKNKTINVGKKVVVPYDYLFLMTGLQYEVPRKRGAKEFAKIKLPSNCFTINTEDDATRALETLKELVAQYAPDKPYQIVIYGHSIDCYCCIAALLEFGIPGGYITLIDPWPKDKDPPVNHNFVFQDGGIYETVVNLVTHHLIDIRSGFKLIDWYSTPLSLKFESLTRYLVLTPLCAFLYSDKSVNANMFTAIHEAGLVFDGRLVIDPDCHTNDKFIYAAGPLTKYSRKLWADHLSHEYFNSEEIGARLGQTIRSFLLPFKERRKVKYEFGKSCWNQTKHLVPYYFKPLITYCKLPGGLFYLNVVKPGPQIPLETAMSDSDYGTVFTTGNCKTLKLQGYFRVHLNNHRMVETITCLSMQKFDFRKLVLVWGKHEALLNNLVRRFELIYITDFFEYFQKAWASVIFLDDFPLLESAIMKVMTSLTDVEGESPLEDLYRMYMENGFRPLTAEQRNTVNEKFTDSGYDEKIQTLIMDFIRDNLGVLDMYAHPVIVNYILSGYEQSPMFKKI